MVTLAILLCFAVMAVNNPKPPTFLHAPSIAGEHFAIELDLQIEPHPDIRSVTLEAWDAVPAFDNDDPDLPMLVPGMFVTSDAQPVTELMAAQRTFRFIWRQGLNAGKYILVAKVVSANPYRSAETKRQLIVQ